MSTLVETISTKPIPDHQKNVILDIAVEHPDEDAADDEDIDLPYVMLKLNK